MGRCAVMVVLTLAVGGCDWVFGLAEPTDAPSSIDATVDASRTSDGGAPSTDAGFNLDGAIVIFDGGIVPVSDAVATN